MIDTGNKVESIDLSSTRHNKHNNDKLSKPNIQSGIKGASANLINSIVGAGIIGIPYALKESGLVAGIFLLLMVGYLTDKSLRVIVGLACFHPSLRTRNVRTYEDLASYPFGRLGSFYVLINMFVLAYGAMVAYLLIIKDTVPTLMGYDDSVLDRNVIMTVTSLCIMVPLSMQRDMASLAITSLLSVLADVVLVIFIAAFAPMKETVVDAGGFRQVLENDSVNPTLFIGLGILSTAMACQHSAFIVCGSLRNKTMRRWSIVTGFSIGVATLLCGVLGVTGYLGFLEETQGDILNNFDSDSGVANGARVLLAITMFFTYPMEIFVARHVVIVLYHDGDIDGKDDLMCRGTEESGGLCGMNRRQTWTVGIYLITLIPALLVSDIGPVLSITGSVGGSCLAYIGPGLVYIGLNGQQFLDYAYGLLDNSKKMSGGEERALNRPVSGGMYQDMAVSNGRFVSIISENEKNRWKPIWWYIGGFPIWCAIASIGSRNMREKLGDDGNGNLNIDSSSYVDGTVGENAVTLPTQKDFYIAIFFTIFGVIGAIAGVASNIYSIYDHL